MPGLRARTSRLPFVCLASQPDGDRDAYLITTTTTTTTTATQTQTKKQKCLHPGRQADPGLHRPLLTNSQTVARVWEIVAVCPNQTLAGSPTSSGGSKKHACQPATTTTATDSNKKVEMSQLGRLQHARKQTATHSQVQQHARNIETGRHSHRHTTLSQRPGT